ncbi:efflux RND transporter periplasmic adaptor subunit [Halodesulfovibrio marinisediminis]|uniref:RND family efflux transporter, MFP subunit n=1 Tax=Halodesulfovibrio marinisediminis DSM 17456 TaxID=1121457 RepID=A0A1N6DSN6_9BACT|nr:efflux RND transporter periplasmic adaptor subunit [Halodesulfovibrio marinisediminis]SIN73799.1 RND family efflux transporter, MFP subunit [Halodesulfovibrio marinisediminis DSM 17456]
MVRKILFIALCLLPLLAGCKEEKVAKVIRPVKAMKVVASNQGATRVFPGKVEASSEVALAFRVGGQLTSYPVSKGQFVKKGSLIAALDTTDYKIQVRGLEAQLFGAKAALKEAQLSYSRYSTLVANDTAAKASFDQAEANYKTAQAKVKSLTEQLNKAKTDLGYASLRAPFSGYISEKYMDNYQTIQVGQPVVKLQDIETLEVTIGLPDNLVIRQKDLQSISVELEAFPGKYIEAKVKELALDVEPVTRTYPLTVQFIRPKDISFLPGMAANVTLHFAQNGVSAQYVLPETAVVGDPEGRSAVWVYDSSSSSVEHRLVKTGQIFSEGIEVTDGLKQGEWVVTAGAHYLSAGQKVRLLDPVK